MNMQRRPPTGLGRPPSAAGGMARPPSARPPSAGLTRGGSRMGPSSGIRAPTASGDRPGTQRPNSAAFRAGTPDRTYYIVELRNKMSDLQTEIERLEDESEKMRNDEQRSSIFHRKESALVDEISALRGQLADFNTVVDLARANVGLGGLAGFDSQEVIETMEDETEALKQSNESAAQRLDDIFSQRQTLESDADRIETEVRQHDETSSSLVDNMPPVRQAQYHHLMDEHERLMEEQASAQANLDVLLAKQAQLEDELANDTEKKDILRLRQERDTLERRKAELSSQTEKPQDYTSLLAKAKADNRVMSEFQLKTQQMEGTCTRLQERLNQLEEDLQEKTGEKSSRFAILQQKDHEMQRFIDTFEENKNREALAIEERQNLVVELLLHMSRGVHDQNHLPTPGQLTELQSDLSFKREQLDHSQTTHERLQKELVDREDELEKLNSFDSKIGTEIDAINTKLLELQAEIAKYSDLDGLRATENAKRQALLDEKSHLIARRERFAQLNESTRKETERLRAAISGDRGLAQLESQEKKLKHHEMVIFQLQDFISTSSREIDFQQLHNQCLSLIEEINSLHIKNAQESGTTSS
eukprot:gnl/Trimastix_PCT/1938.p1 GENE.gnl/Trimastix_PCT/1938~~gnl/Trimastix_PCT/1938.p1  ORF type:complete len:589 (-),score=134.97 gnl/Trimastix_PCT/1938:121-1887(-)